MTQFEYLIPFVGIIYALSATDLLVSTHRIIVERHHIKFHLVPFVWALVAFLLIVNAWWGFLQLNDKITLENAGQLFVLSLLALTVFLISSLSLPHQVNQNLCMWEYFCKQKTALYLCHTVYLVLIPVVLGSFADDINTAQVSRNVVLSIIFVGLIWVKHWGWHLTAGILFSMALLTSIFKQSIVLQ